MGRKRSIGKRATVARILHDRVTEAVKAEIEVQGFSYYRIAQDTGISGAALSRFRQPGGTLKTESLLMLFNYLGIDLVINRGESKMIYKSHGPHSME